MYRGLSLGSGYWVQVTVLFVLKPATAHNDDARDRTGRGNDGRGHHRLAIVTLFSPADGTSVILLGLLACAAYALFPANYALFSVILTVLVALLTEFSGGSPVGALADQIVDSAIGTAIALAAITLWPSRPAAALTAVHDGHARDAIASYRAALDASFAETVSALDELWNGQSR